MLELYRNIKKYRLERNMSQAELAKLTEYTDRSTIARIENGEIDISQSKILLFAKALCVSPGTLMGNTGLYASDLSSEKSELLDGFGRLNASGKTKVLEYVADLLDNMKYVATPGKLSISGTA